MPSCQFIIFIILVFGSTLSVLNDDQTKWKEAKRQLARKTREYLRENPPSNELREFIENIKRNNRKKRQDHSNMYAIKNGEVVPLDKIEQDLNYADNSLGENFTVVPLLIPIPLKNTVTMKDREDDIEETSYRDAFDRENAPSKRKEHYYNSGTEETVVDSLIENKLKSTSDSTALSKVLEDVEKLINSQKKGRFPNDGALCNVFGYWDSRASGMSFHIKKSESGEDIVMKPTDPPREDGFMLRERWNVTIQVPFEQRAQAIISAVSHKDRRIVVFVGECRVCEGSETITGDWIVSRPSSGCKDQKASHAFFADILRKNNIETLRDDHLKKCTKEDLGFSTTDRL